MDFFPHQILGPFDNGGQLFFGLARTNVQPSATDGRLVVQFQGLVVGGSLQKIAKGHPPKDRLSSVHIMVVDQSNRSDGAPLFGKELAEIEFGGIVGELRDVKRKILRLRGCGGAGGDSFGEG